MADSTPHQGDRRPVPGSHRDVVPGFSLSGATDGGQEAAVTVYLRRAADPEGDAPPLAREDFADRHGLRPEDLDALAAAARAAGVAVDEVDRARRSVVLRGALADLAGLFGTELSTYRHADGRTYRGRLGELSVPAALHGAVTAVVGLDDRPQARPHFRIAAAGASGYPPPEVASAYDFPAGTDGTGQCVALVELGGGYRDADLAAYFGALGLPSPTVTAVGVDGGSNTPGASNGPDGEVMLDIEVVGACAPGARIAVYFAPNTDQGFLDAVTTAVHDTTNRPSVVSISWGGPESTWTAQAAQQMEQAFVDAAALGVTVTVAAGDNGSADGVNDGEAHVDFPASAPHALACGGTSLTVTGGSIGTEVVWDDLAQGGGATGGGVSDLFPLPAYQSGAGVPASANPGGHVGRGVPDVAGDADPQTGYAVRVDGQDMVIGGTSAVAPLWAALVARLNQAVGRNLGDLHGPLYGDEAALHDITSGTNGAYSARVGWDACTGLGSPDGAALLVRLRSATTGPASP